MSTVSISVSSPKAPAPQANKAANAPANGAAASNANATGLPGGLDANDATLPADFASLLLTLNQSEGATGSLTFGLTGDGEDGLLPGGRGKSRKSGAGDLSNVLAAAVAAAGQNTPSLLTSTNKADGESDALSADALAGGRGSDLTAWLSNLQSGAKAADGTAAGAANLAGAPGREFADILQEADSTAAQTTPLHVLELNPPSHPHTQRAETPREVKLDTPFEAPRWSDDFNQKVVWMAKQDIQSAQLSINPPQLGPIEITLNMNEDAASAVFTSPHAEVREVLENAMPRLREMLAGAGVNLGQAEVGSQTPREQQAFQQQAEQMARERQNRNGGESANPVSVGGVTADNSISGVRVHAGIGLVDTFV